MHSIPLSPSAPYGAYFHASTKDFAPDKRQTNPVRTALVSTGYALSISGNIVLMFSPLIRKHAGTIVKQLAQRFGPEARLKLLSPQMLSKLEETLPDKGKLEKFLWAVLGAGFLCQMPMEYKTSLNSRQPSMLLCNVITTASTACMLFSSNVVFRVMTVMGDVFHRAGKYNDINNSNHLNNRREWNLRRFSNGNETPGHALQSFTRYVGHDLKQVFSLNPWKNIASDFRDKKTWTEPNANLTATAGQLALFAGGTTLLTNVKSLGKYHKTLQGIAIGSIVLHDAMFQSPIFMRGWQNRHETDGKLVVGSIPFYMLGSPFFLSKNLLFMNSFTGIANPFWAKGINLNSEHRLATVNYIRKLYAQALADPTIQAKDILQFIETQPDMQRVMKKRMGTSGLHFVLQTLLQAERMRQTQQVPLAQVLFPITIAKES